MCLYVWRRVRDSNPEALADQRFSRPRDYQLSQLSIFGQGGGIRTHSARGNGFTARPDSPTSAPPDMYCWSAGTDQLPYLICIYLRRFTSLRLGRPLRIRTLTKRVGAAYATVTPTTYIFGGGGEIRTPAPSQGPNALAVRPLRPA